ncbi:MAG: AMP-binding protein, partial [Alteriqipengyuania sp.]
MSEGGAAAAAASGGLLGDIILDAIARHGDAIAFVDDEGETSYRAFGQMVAQAMERLDELGLPRGATVAQISENCTRQYALMAAAYIGGYRSLTLHAMGGREDQLYILKDSGARILVGGPGRIADAASLARDAGIACYAHQDDDAVGPFWPA